MWNPKDEDITPAKMESENLNALLDLMLSSMDTLPKQQTETLLGLALNLSHHLLIWFEEEEKRQGEQ